MKQSEALSSAVLYYSSFLRSTDIDGLARMDLVDGKARWIDLQLLTFEPG